MKIAAYLWVNCCLVNPSFGVMYLHLLIFECLFNNKLCSSNLVEKYHLDFKGNFCKGAAKVAASYEAKHQTRQDVHKMSVTDVVSTLVLAMNYMTLVRSKYMLDVARWMVGPV